jgi:hypothetical protein
MELQILIDIFFLIISVIALMTLIVFAFFYGVIITAALLSFLDHVLHPERNPSKKEKLL